MADVHIVCKRPAPPVQPDDARYPIINGIVASIADCEVTINGVPVTNVESITWTVRWREPARAVVTFIGATVDVDGIVADPDEESVTCTCARVYSAHSRLPQGRARNPECEIHGAPTRAHVDALPWPGQLTEWPKHPGIHCSVRDEDHRIELTHFALRELEPFVWVGDDFGGAEYTGTITRIVITRDGEEVGWCSPEQALGSRHISCGQEIRGFRFGPEGSFPPAAT